MIPKVIHYCWFGRKELPRKAQKCILSWKKYCPDYDIIEWNEDNFDVNQHPYLKWCYENKKWAFLSDFARLLIIEKHGGIYLDTDVEILSDFSILLKEEAFLGFESNEYVNTGLGFGAVAEHIVVKEMMKQYLNRIPDEDGNINMIGCPVLNTKALCQLGLSLSGKMQMVSGAKILPIDYMNPYDDATGILRKTDNTISIHWYTKSALSKGIILRSKFTRPFHRILGTDCFKWLKKEKRS